MNNTSLFGLTLCIFVFATIIFALIALAKKDEHFCQIIKKIATRSIFFGAFALVALFGVFSSFASVSDSLTRILQPESIDSFRVLFKTLFGTESVFSSLQLLISLLMVTVSVMSGLVCVLAVECLCRIFINRTQIKNNERRNLRKALHTDYFAGCKLPVLYSRLLN